ncbi:MAG: CBS domain-containing protein [Micromonosporaceae bacterium]|nr:CBS domain-containing protein [Micromonosporaceae bacterium]
MSTNTVADVMTREVTTMEATTTLDKAAEVMRTQAIGDVVVTESDQILGLVTDRDIVVRAVAEGLDPAGTALGMIVSRDVITVAPEDTMHTAALLMRDRAVRRLLVLSESGNLAGILSIGDLAAEIDPESVLGAISDATPNA